MNDSITMNDSINGGSDVDLFSVETSDSLDIESLPQGVALGTFSTASTSSTASCPISSAACIMSANCAG